MAYPSIAWTANAARIGEREWAFGPVIRFGGIESCIAVIGRTPAGAIGIHLTVIDEVPALFTREAARAVHTILLDNHAVQHGGRPAVGIVGDVNSWAIDPQVSDAYHGLLFGVAVVGVHSAKGDYAAQVVDGHVTVAHGGVGLGWTV